MNIRGLNFMPIAFQNKKVNNNQNAKFEKSYYIRNSQQDVFVKNPSVNDISFGSVKIKNKNIKDIVTKGTDLNKRTAEFLECLGIKNVRMLEEKSELNADEFIREFGLTPKIGNNNEVVGIQDKNGKNFNGTIGSNDGRFFRISKSGRYFDTIFCTNDERSFIRNDYKNNSVYHISFFNKGEKFADYSKGDKSCHIVKSHSKGTLFANFNNEKVTVKGGKNIVFEDFDGNIMIRNKDEAGKEQYMMRVGNTKSFYPNPLPLTLTQNEKGNFVLLNRGKPCFETDTSGIKETTKAGYYEVTPSEYSELMNKFIEYKKSFDEICDVIKTDVTNKISAEIQNDTLMVKLLK